MEDTEVVRVDESTFRVDGVTFVSDMASGVSTPERFAIMKPPDLIERYLALPHGERVVELGVREGGSTAFLALAGEVGKLVAFEISRQPAPALVGLIEQRGLDDVIRPYFATDQSDRERLRAVVADEFGGAPLDLVVDDASHRLEPTLASFETLFPCLAPGGLFVIEDWAWQQCSASNVEQYLAHDDEAKRRVVLDVLADPDAEATAAFNRAVVAAMQDPSDEMAAHFAAGLAAALEEHDIDELHERNVPLPPPEPPLLHLVVQLLLAVGISDQVVARVEIDPYWVTVTRGPAPLDPATFRLADVAPDFHGLLDR